MSSKSHLPQLDHTFLSSNHHQKQRCQLGTSPGKHEPVEYSFANHSTQAGQFRESRVPIACDTYRGLQVHLPTGDVWSLDKFTFFLPSLSLFSQDGWSLHSAGQELIPITLWVSGTVQIKMLRTVSLVSPLLLLLPRINPPSQFPPDQLLVHLLSLSSLPPYILSP